MSQRTNDGTLDSWTTLRLAAAQVDEEDQLEGSMGLLQAADEVAAILNLPSPLRYKKQDERASDRLSSTNESNFDRTTHSLSLSESQIQTAIVHKDADQLLRDMKIDPKPIVSHSAGHSVAFEDVNALLKLGGVSKEENEDYYSPRVPRDQEHYSGRTMRGGKDGSLRVRDHYLNRLHSNRSSQQSRYSHSQSASIARSAATLTSQPSHLSRRLTQLSAEQQQRLCASDLQRYLLSSMQVLSTQSQHSNSSSAKSSRTSLIRPRTQQLAVPVSHSTRSADREGHFLLYEEAEECVFEPNHKKRELERRKQRQSRGRNGYGSDEEEEKTAKMGKDAAFFAFLSRQEGEERKRREELKFLQKELDYNARLDKKVCPSCGAVQSYDEVREKRKQCPGCQIAYAAPLCWSQVARQFLKRAREHQRKKVANLSQLAQEILVAERGELLTKDQQGSHKHPLMCDVEAFLQRLTEATDRRNRRRDAIEREVYKDVTFQPNLNRKSELELKRRGEDEDDIDLDDELVSVMSADPVKDFLLRYEQDMEDRRRRMPQKYRSKEQRREGNQEAKQGSNSPKRLIRF